MLLQDLPPGHGSVQNGQRQQLHQAGARQRRGQRRAQDLGQPGRQPAQGAKHTEQGHDVAVGAVRQSGLNAEVLAQQLQSPRRQAGQQHAGRGHGVDGAKRPRSALFGH